jgi:hypothetical protein
VAIQTILVCDYCGNPATASASVKLGGASWTLDLCTEHATEITSRARRARPGRRPSLSAPAAAAAPRKRASRSKAKATRKSTAKRRTRTRARAASAEAGPAE